MTSHISSETETIWRVQSSPEVADWSQFSDATLKDFSEAEKRIGVEWVRSWSLSRLTTATGLAFGGDCADEEVGPRESLARSSRHSVLLCVHF